VSLYKALPFDTRKDLAPVALLGGTTNVLVVGPKTSAKTVQELVEQAKRNPGKLNFASNGNGTTIHLSGELLKLYAGFDARHIPYRGAPAAMAALLAGDVDFMFDALPPSAPHIKGGRVRLLAVTSRERQAMFPDAPTLVESGFADFEVNSWTGLMTTGGTPAPVIARLESELRRILAEPDAIAAFEKTGMTVSFGSARRFGELLDAEIGRWALAVKHSGAQAD
jgi:tripartite-type tricarboxylate transporter receptor subunit TctC